MRDAMPLKRYRPSNCTEGAEFISHWCGHCARDLALNGAKIYYQCTDDELCSIVAATYAYDVNDEDYPREWVHDEDGPRCTAFVPAGENVPTERCPHTVDMFGESESKDE